MNLFQRALVVAVCSVLSLPEFSAAATLLVQPDGLGDFPTIQAAIQAAAVGDTVLLADGVFAGPGNREIEYLGKAITIMSASGSPEDCIIDAQALGRPIRFVSNETRLSVLQGVSVVNGYGDLTP